MKFVFQAIDEHGKPLRGVLEASDEKAARNMLLGEILFPKRLEPAADDTKITWVARKRPRPEEPVRRPGDAGGAVPEPASALPVPLAFVPAIWALLAAGAAWVWFAQVPTDGFAGAAAAILAGWAVTSHFWLRKSGGDRRTRLRWMAGQAVAATMLAILLMANAAAALRERQRAAFDAQVPDYPDAFPKVNDLAPSTPGPGGRLLPNLHLSAKSPNPGRAVRFTTNNIGARNTGDTAIPKPTGTYRVLLVGDSFTVGYRVGDDELFGAVLERKLNAQLAAGSLAVRAERIEVVRINTEAPPPTWYWFEKHATQLEPDLIVYCLCLANDFSQSLFMLGEPPNPPFAEWSLGADGLPAPNTTEELKKWEEPFKEWLWSEANRYPARAMTIPPITAEQLRARRGEVTPSPWALGRALQAVAAAVAGYEGFSFSPLPTDPVFAHGETGLFLRDTHPSFAIAERTLVRCLEGFAAWRDAHGVPVALAVIPVRYQVGPQDRNTTFSAPGLGAEAFDLEKPNRLLAKEAERLGLPLFDWTPVFAAKGEDAWREFMPRGDIHWNERGHLTAAESLLPEAVRWIESSE